MDIHLHLSYPVGCGFKFRAVWPAGSHLAVFHEALFWLYIATILFRHGLDKLPIVSSGLCMLVVPAFDSLNESLFLH